MRRIEGFLGGELPEPEPAAEGWDAEGGREPDTPSSDRQLFQCTQAAKFLLEESVRVPLSVVLIVRTHAIMMTGAYNSERRGRVPVVVGRMRRAVAGQPSEDVNAGWYRFLPSWAVAGAVAQLVEKYNEAAARGTMHPVSLATFLFYELISIHPFGNGNGRLCRLFLAWSLLRDGYPFAAPFSSGHKNRRQHYVHAINSARRPVEGHRGELNVICLTSLEQQLGNYLTNARLLATATRAEPATPATPAAVAAPVAA